MHVREDCRAGCVREAVQWRTCRSRQQRWADLYSEMTVIRVVLQMPIS